MKYLGESFDIHSGGEDNIFPHHENEIAQSEAATGKPFAKYWIHAKHVLMNGEKMSKSLGNFITVKDAIGKYGALNLRFFFLNTHYRKTIDFSEKELGNTNAKLGKILSAFEFLDSANGNKDSKELIKKLSEFRENFESAMNDDFNTSLAITHWIAFCKELQAAKGLPKSSAKVILDYFNKISSIFFGDLALKKEGKSSESCTALIESLIALRNNARHEKNFGLSDSIRQELEKNGVTINDSKDSTTWSY
jgi:cysteinyl-tRNA synthetase